MTTHIVQPGESLSNIAHHYYGDANKFHMLANANGINPNQIHVGDLLDIPSAGSMHGGFGDVSYTVQSGDSLSSIAQMYYGNTSAYMQIATANGISDPNSISVGQVLDIPGVSGLYNAAAPAATPAASTALIPVSTPASASNSAPAASSNSSNINSQILMIAGVAAVGAAAVWWWTSRASAEAQESGVRSQESGKSNPESEDYEFEELEEEE